MSIVEPRNQHESMQADWEWILKTLRMCQDRALTGTPLILRRPDWFPPHGDVKQTLCRGVKQMVDDVFSTAVVEREDAPKSAP